MRISIGTLVSLSLVLSSLLNGRALAAETPLRADQAAFRELYEELVETNTTLSSGSCTMSFDERRDVAAYVGTTGGGEFPTAEAAFAWASEQPWGPIRWRKLKQPRRELLLNRSLRT